MSLLSLEGKVAFISGSTRGIGWATAQLFAEHGATIILNGHSNPGLLAERVETLKMTYGIQAKGILADFSNPSHIQNCYNEIFQIYKGVDIVVNNAGIMVPALLGMISDENVVNSFSLNAISLVYSTQAAARLMMRRKSGSIINSSSIVGIQGTVGQTVYAGTKAAVIGITKAAAKELAPHQIRVNCVAPGVIATDLTASIPKDIISDIKMGRIGDPKDVAKAILFFASPLSEYVTGQVLGVDGAMII